MPEAPPPAATQWMPLLDLLLEIVARSDTRTLVRCAAACKLLRRDILSSSFICRVTQQGGIVPPCILTYLNTHHDDKVHPPPPLLSLLHPATTAAAWFMNANLSPSVSRSAGDLLREYYPVTSGGGLILLHRRRVSNTLPNLCVYDLIIGHRTFLSNPPGIKQSRCFDICFLLTPADGIDSYFSLVVANLEGPHRNNNTINIQVHTTTSTCGTWAPSVMIHGSDNFITWRWFAMCRDAIVLHGGVIHWLLRSHGEIVTYNVCTKEQRTINLPVHITNFKGQLYLGSYYVHDGRKLPRLLGADGCKIYLWDQLPGGYWESEAMMIDMEEKLRSLDTKNGPCQPAISMFKYIGERSNTLLMHVHLYHSSTSTTTLPFVLDLETKEMYVQQY